MLKNLQLNRPLAFIDIETTGLRPYSDRIVELSILRINPDGTEEYKSHRVNPGVSIPAESTAIHGITDAAVASEPMFQRYAKSVRDFLEDCDIAGFNVIKFDLPCLEAELARANVKFSRGDRYFIDSQIIFHQREPRSLQAAYQKYCSRDMVNAHSAEEDAKVSAEVLDGQLEMYQDLPRDVPGLSALCYRVEKNYIDSEGKFIWVEGEAVCNFGKKYKGRKLTDIAIEDPSYLEWITKADFSTEVNEIVIKALEGEFPKPPNSSGVV
ncbi:exonuclease domain-containing protein [Chloroflexota bacterium]